jgi:hypothetical protein
VVAIEAELVGLRHVMDACKRDRKDELVQKRHVKRGFVIIQRILNTCRGNLSADAVREIADIAGCLGFKDLAKAVEDIGDEEGAGGGDGDGKKKDKKDKKVGIRFRPLRGPHVACAHVFSWGISGGGGRGIGEFSIAYCDENRTCFCLHCAAGRLADRLPGGLIDWLIGCTGD